MTKTVQTAVVGVTGYAGAELARLLLRHPRLQGTPPVFAGRVDERDMARGGVPLSEIHPQLADCNGSSALKLEPFSWELLARRGVGVLFLATPHEQSREWVPEALRRGMRVIDPVSYTHLSLPTEQSPLKQTIGRYRCPGAPRRKRKSSPVRRRPLVPWSRPACWPASTAARRAGGRHKQCRDGGRLPSKPMRASAS